MSKAMTRKAWLEYLQKAVDEFDWDDAEQEQGEPVTWNLKDVTDAYKLGAKSQKRTWVGLTDIEINDLVHSHDDFDGLWEFADAVEAKLKEKNT